MNIKRVNLYFNIEREEDNYAYEIILKQKKKTDYIINLIARSNDTRKEDMKALIKEIIEEYDFRPKNKEKLEKQSIPKDIYEFFEQI